VTVAKIAGIRLKDELLHGPSQAERAIFAAFGQPEQRSAWWAHDPADVDQGDPEAVDGGAQSVKHGVRPGET